jgi:hypothetical protein
VSWKSLQSQFDVDLVLLSTIGGQDEPIKKLTDDVTFLLWNTFQIATIIWLLFRILELFLVDSDKIILETLFSGFLFFTLGVIINF